MSERIPRQTNRLHPLLQRQSSGAFFEANRAARNAVSPSYAMLEYEGFAHDGDVPRLL
jgi:hypothetical protein